MAKTLRKRRQGKVNSRKIKEKVIQRKHTHLGAIRDKELRKRFDKTKTLRQNMQATDMKEMYKNVLPKKIPKKGAHPVKVNEDEAPIIKTLMKKHGDDYDKMFWDIKVNVMQWTKSEVMKKVKAFKGGKIRSMAAEIMSGHGMDLRKPIFGAAKDRNVFGH
ncbi:unnamed protein product [Polarella glacialis]|uniref:Nucleolar protein 16 n=1 Tax=Polarella glacialis TaxID=89957 RepID=A0A813EMZ9_POLGL|nr:unnamed protein product [Polarella glacialis]CAE8633001.1 unnamed protein product [Polarella glacialis]